MSTLKHVWFEGFEILLYKVCGAALCKQSSKSCRRAVNGVMQGKEARGALPERKNVNIQKVACWILLMMRSWDAVVVKS